MPKKVKERDDRKFEVDEVQGSIWLLLLNFAILVAITAIICAIIWKTTHKNPKTELGRADSSISQSQSSNNLLAKEEVDENTVSGDSETEVDPVDGDTTMVFEEVDEEVTAKDAAIIRTIPNTEGITTVAGQLRNGQVLKRIGVNKETGWSKVIYNGQEGYAVSYYLTTDKNYVAMEAANPDNRVTTADGYVILFRDCDETVTVAGHDSVNLRTEPSTTQGKATISATLQTGLTARRTGISIDSGWSRVEFNGLVLYVVTQFVQEINED